VTVALVSPAYGADGDEELMSADFGYSVTVLNTGNLDSILDTVHEEALSFNQVP
jgi:hypothetical protein